MIIYDAVMMAFTIDLIPQEKIGLKLRIMILQASCGVQ